MKKSIALVALAFGVTSAFAQDLTSKKGEPFLPEAGDWGIAIDANPFFTYAQSIFGKTAGTAPPSWNFFTNAQTITGKYFVDAQTAYRGSVRIGFGSNTVRNQVADRSVAAGSQTVFPNPVAQKENSWKNSGTTIGLAVGIEKRKGKTRLQGYYGADAGIYISTMKDKFTYGNALVASTTPSSNVGVTPADDFGPGANNFNATGTGIQGVLGSARATEIKQGTVFSFGVRAFIGAEYFILPKMSIGGEFGWGLGLTTTGKTKTTYESVGNPTTPTVGTTVIEGSKQSGFTLDTDGKNSVWGPSGTLRFNLYF